MDEYFEKEDAQPVPASEAEPSKALSIYLDELENTSGEGVLQYLPRVVAIAKSKFNGKVRLEDVIQEGNMGLFLKYSEYEGRELPPDFDSIIDEAITEAIESYIQTETTDIDNENAIVGKMALISAAKKVLAEENGTEPTMEELSEYTKIPVEELSDISNLMKDL